MTIINRLKDLYQKTAVPALMSEFGIKHPLAVPKLQKIVVSVGITEDQHQKEALDNFGRQLQVITGQVPKVTTAKQSIAGFKLRAGDPIGLMVTLRGLRMYQFADKLINIVLPRVKDFQGVKRTSFDQGGNYNLGIEEQIVFPEIEYGKIDQVRGLQITFVTNAKSSDQALRLLQLLGMPFTKDN